MNVACVADFHLPYTLDVGTMGCVERHLAKETTMLPAIAFVLALLGLWKSITGKLSSSSAASLFMTITILLGISLFLRIAF